MKVLGITLAGIILGYIIGAKFGEWKAVEEAGGFAIFFMEGFTTHYGGWGAAIGGAAGFFLGVNLDYTD